MAFQNNVTRFLESRGVAYQVFELSEEKHTAEETAALLGVPVDHVYKTLVVLRESKGKRPMLVMAPAGRELNLKSLAVAIGEKKLSMATQAEAERLTGLQTGGISPLALLNRGFDIYIAAEAEQLDYLHLSAGQRGANLRLKPGDLIELVKARIVRTSKPGN